MQGKQYKRIFRQDQTDNDYMVLIDESFSLHLGYAELQGEANHCPINFGEARWNVMCQLLRVFVLSLVTFPMTLFGQSATPDEEPTRIVLTPVQGEMICYADVPSLPDQRFALGLPETIGCREEMMLLNFPEVRGRLKWSGPDSAGVLSAG